LKKLDGINPDLGLYELLVMDLPEEAVQIVFQHNGSAYMNAIVFSFDNRMIQD